MLLHIEKAASKYIERLNDPAQSRILKALDGLEEEPPVGDITLLKGKFAGMYRLRVGGYRALFFVRKSEVVVFDVAPRGRAYK